MWRCCRCKGSHAFVGDGMSVVVFSFRFEGVEGCHDSCVLLWVYEGVIDVKFGCGAVIDFV